MVRRDRCKRHCISSSPIDGIPKDEEEQYSSMQTVKFSHEGTRPKFRNHLNNVIHFDVLEMLRFWIDSIVDTVALR